MSNQLSLNTGQIDKIIQDLETYQLELIICFKDEWEFLNNQIINLAIREYEKRRGAK